MLIGLKKSGGIITTIVNRISELGGLTARGDISAEAVAEAELDFPE